MKRITLAALFLLVPVLALAWTLTWDPVTHYTDNTLIGPEAEGVFYTVEMDGTVTSAKQPEADWLIPDVPKKSTRTFRVMTVLGTGEASEWTDPFAWTSPAGTPSRPGRVRVVP